MRWLRGAVHELFGLFVDDGAFALAIVLWLGIVWLVLSRLAPGAPWIGVILFAGLALILVESVLRRASK